MTASPCEVSHVADPLLSPITVRRPELDWLRVLAFAVLVVFHAAVAFTPNPIPMTANAEPSLPLMVLVAFLHEFRLSLLFLVSGVGMCFALRHRSTREFIVDRALRLGVPLLFGVLVLVPPMVWLEKRWTGEYSESLPTLWLELFNGSVYPVGHLSWHHFWFVAYLLLMALLLVPVTRWLATPRGEHWLAQRLPPLARGYRVFLLALPLAVAEIALRAVFPGFRDLVHDWASFVHWWLVLLAGYALARHAPLLDRVRELAMPALVLASACSLTLFMLFWDPVRGALMPGGGGAPTVAGYLLWCVLRMLNVTCWLIACTGLAARWLATSSPLLDRLTAAVYPLFCLHLTVLVGWEVLVLPLALPAMVKFTVLVLATFVTVAALYLTVVRRSRWLGFVLGYPSAHAARMTRAARVMAAWLVTAGGLFAVLPVQDSAAASVPDQPSAASASGRVVGVWTDGRSIVTIQRAGNGITMRLTALLDAVYRSDEVPDAGTPRRDDNNPDPKLAARPLAGIDLLQDAAWRDGAWQGRLYDPDGGRTWQARLTVNGAGRLQVRGHVGVALLGRTVEFQRVTACTPVIRAMRIVSGLPDCAPCASAG